MVGHHPFSTIFPSPDFSPLCTLECVVCLCSSNSAFLNFNCLSFLWHTSFSFHPCVWIFGSSLSRESLRPQYWTGSFSFPCPHLVSHLSSLSASSVTILFLCFCPHLAPPSHLPDPGPPSVTCGPVLTSSLVFLLLLLSSWSWLSCFLLLDSSF